MLIRDVDPAFLVKYESYLREKVSSFHTEFRDLDSLSAKELSYLIRHASARSRGIKRAEAFLADRENYLKPHDIFARTGRADELDLMADEEIDHIMSAQYYSMDSAFVTDMISMGHFKVPKSYQVGDDLWQPLRGATSSMLNLLYAISRSERKYPELKKNKFVVNVQESNDWELLALLGHDNGVYRLNPLKLDVSFKKDFRPLSKYKDYTYGSQRYGILDSTESSPLGEILSFREPMRRARAGVVEYREKNQSFLFFEILLVDDEYAGESFGMGKSTAWGM